MALHIEYFMSWPSKRLLQCLDVDALFHSELVNSQGKFSIDCMLMVRRKLQRGTTTKSEHVIHIDPKFALQRVTDETDPWDKNGKLKKMMVQEVSQRVRIIQVLAKDVEKEKKVCKMRWQNTKYCSHSRFEFNSFCVAVGWMCQYLLQLPHMSQLETSTACSSSNKEVLWLYATPNGHILGRSWICTVVIAMGQSKLQELLVSYSICLYGYICLLLWCVAVHPFPICNGLTLSCISGPLTTNGWQRQRHSNQNPSFLMSARWVSNRAPYACLHRGCYLPSQVECSYCVWFPLSAHTGYCTALDNIQ